MVLRNGISSRGKRNGSLAGKVIMFIGVPIVGTMGKIVSGGIIDSTFVSYFLLLLFLLIYIKDHCCPGNICIISMR